MPFPSGRGMTVAETTPFSRGERGKSSKRRFSSISAPGPLSGRETSWIFSEISLTSRAVIWETEPPLEAEGAVAVRIHGNAPVVQTQAHIVGIPPVPPRPLQCGPSSK